MTGALVDGALRGFNAMEQYKNNEFRKNRSIEHDERTEKRYQDSQLRLRDIDEQNERRYNDNKNLEQTRYDDRIEKEKIATEETSKHRLSMLDQSKQRTDNSNKRVEQQQQQYKWQQNQAEEKKQFEIISPQFANIHLEYRETGVMSDFALNFFDSFPQYSDFDPRTYDSKEVRDNVKNLTSKVKSIFKSGKTHELKSPEFVELFNGAFKSKIQQGIGEQDLIRNATIVDKSVGQIIPTRDGKVSIGLKVTYQKQNGETYSEMQPMTKGRTSDKEDPVNEFEMKELLAGLKIRQSMVDGAESNMQQERSDRVLGAAGFGKEGVNPKETKANNKEHRKEVNSLRKDIRKIQSEMSDFSSDEVDAKLLPYKQAINEADQAYGKEPTYPELTEGGESKESVTDFSQLSDDELMAKLKEPKSSDTEEKNKPKITSDNKQKTKTVSDDDTYSEAEPDYSEWASPPQNLMEVSGLNAIGRKAKEGIDGVIDWNKKKKISAYLVRKLGRMPTEEEIQQHYEQES